jgi:hypothetical protein
MTQAIFQTACTLQLTRRILRVCTSLDAYSYRHNKGEGALPGEWSRVLSKRAQLRERIHDLFRTQHIHA